MNTADGRSSRPAPRGGSGVEIRRPLRFDPSLLRDDTFPAIVHIPIGKSAILAVPMARRLFMAAKILPASAGWQWLRSGTNLVLRHPAPLSLSTFLVVLCTFALSWLPVLGSIINILLGSIVIAGLAAIYRGVEKGEEASLDLFLHPVEEKSTPLLILSAVYFAAVTAITLIVYVVSLATDVDIAQLATQLDNSSHLPDINATIRILSVLLVFGLLWFALMVPVLMAYWFSPFLIAWHGMPVGKALRTSFAACLGNWKAFLVNGLVWLLAGWIYAVVAGIIFAISVIAGLLAMFAITLSILIPATFANYYFSYKTIFPEQETPEK
ncbi:MAG: hypothetical protein LBF50_03040 [Azoarcus sp.]|jgi:hypothetical protein|nr:hypothetical protein [Azoarcus sp.]